MISIILSPFIKLYRVLWALSNVFEEVKATVESRVEMSVKPLRATSCSSWVVAGRFLVLVKVLFVMVKCSRLGNCQML